MTVDEMNAAGWVCHRPICDDNCAYPRCMGPRTDDLMNALEGESFARPKTTHTVARDLKVMDISRGDGAVTV